MFGFDRITANHDILGGKASIRGMRISVALVVNLVANGMSTEEIIAEHPDLEPEDIRHALRYAAWVAADDLYTPLAADEELHALLTDEEKLADDLDYLHMQKVKA